MSDEILNRLLSLQDASYKDFHSKLIPDVKNERIIGVRLPYIRSLAKELVKQNNISGFLESLPHSYYEENNLHACILNEIRDIDVLLYELERFLPFVDNWATCDSLRPVILKKYPARLLEFIRTCLKSQEEYTIRFGIEMLMVHFLDDKFLPQYAFAVAEIRSDRYYVNMMIAWYFATALAMQWDSTIGFIEDNRLPVWVHNKTITKACESYRISKDKKEYLKKLRIEKKGC